MKIVYAPGVSRKDSVALPPRREGHFTSSSASAICAAQFNEHMHLVDSNWRYKVHVPGNKSDYWHLAAQEWADQSGIKVTQQPLLTSEGMVTEYTFLGYLQAQAFIAESRRRTFDIQAHNIEMREAGVKLGPEKGPAIQTRELII